MSDFASVAEVPAARAVIYTLGFDHDMVRHALAQAGGNEQLAINFILNGEVHDAASASSSAASIAAPAVNFSGPSFGFGTAFAPAEVAYSSSNALDVHRLHYCAENHGDDQHRQQPPEPVEPVIAIPPPPPVYDFGEIYQRNIEMYYAQDDDDAWTSSSWTSDESSSSFMSPNVLAFPDHLTGRRVSLALVADGKLESPSQLRAQIMLPLELMKAAAWFFALRSPGIKRHREEPPPPLGYMLAEFSPCLPVRVMCGCVATACRRMTTAPASMHMIHRTTWRWAGWIKERVTRGRVRRVQVRPQRRAIFAVRCACRASACVRCVFDACCSKRWLILRCVAVHRSGCIKRAAAFILVCRLLLPPALQADPTFLSRQWAETALRCFAM